MTVLVVLLIIIILVQMWFILYYRAGCKYVEEEFKKTYEQLLIYKNEFHKEMKIKLEKKRGDDHETP